MSKKIAPEIFALCNYAEFTANGKFNIIGVYDQFRIDTSKGVWPRGFIVFTIRTTLTNSIKKIRLQIINKSKTSILDVILDVKIGNNGKANFLFEFSNLKVVEYGGYNIRLTDSDDESLVGETEVTLLPVNEGEQNGPGSSKLPN